MRDRLSSSLSNKLALVQRVLWFHRWEWVEDVRGGEGAASGVPPSEACWATPEGPAWWWVSPTASFVPAADVVGISSLCCCSSTSAGDSAGWCSCLSEHLSKCKTKHQFKHMTTVTKYIQIRITYRRSPLCGKRNSCQGLPVPARGSGPARSSTLRRSCARRNQELC